MTNSLVPNNSGMVAVDPAAFPDLDSAPVGINVDPKYHEFQTGEIVRGYFCGLVMRTIKGSDLLTAVIQTKGGFLMNSGVGLVGQLTHVQPGTPIQVKFVGKKTVGEKGERTNLFEVNVLDAPRPEAQSVTVPPPSPAAAQDLGQTKTQPVPAARPLDPAKLKSYMPGKISRNANVLASQFHRGVLAAKLELIAGSKENRRMLTGWLIGKEHIKDMNQAEVNTLLDWLECRTHEQDPQDYVYTEAINALALAVASDWKPSTEKES